MGQNLRIHEFVAKAVPRDMEKEKTWRMVGRKEQAAA